MRWTPSGRSRNLEDRRGSSGLMRGGVALGGGGVLVLALLSAVFGVDLTGLAGGGGDVTAASGEVAPPLDETPQERDRVAFVSAVLDSTQSMWSRMLPQQSTTPYSDARLVLFRDATASACGPAQSAMGPFYCPRDEKVYIDLSFYDELSERFGAPGDFAQAYVIAHEMGHHVQHLMGVDGEVRRLQDRDPSAANALSVRLELQADCLAGVWGHLADQQGILTPADVEDGLRAAAAIGDDRLQRQATGAVHRESFTHGSSAERASWLQRGLQSGDPAACDTFGRSGG